MVELVIVRHAEAEGQGHYLGRRSDPVLTDKGCSQAEALAAVLDKNYPSDNRNRMLITSPQRRAVQTASFLKGSENNLKIMHEFCEMDFGLWDGLDRTEICSADEALYRQWISDPLGVSPPEGETLAAFKNRIECGLSKLRIMHFQDEEDPGKRVILFTHGGVVRLLLCILLDLPLEKFWSFNIGCAGYSVVRIYQDGFSILHKHNFF